MYKLLFYNKLFNFLAVVAKLAQLYIVNFNNHCKIDKLTLVMLTFGFDTYAANAAYPG